MTMTNHGEAQEFMRLAIASQTDDCVIWPYAADQWGYGRVMHDGRNRRVMTVVLTATAGPKPDRHQAAHGPCHNPTCVNPRHLSWKTYRENQHDRVRDGSNARSHLTVEAVADIRRRVHNGETHRAVAERHRISRGHVGAIVNRVRWAGAS
jgi:hypothetical protein